MFAATRLFAEAYKVEIGLLRTAFMSVITDVSKLTIHTFAMAWEKFIRCKSDPHLHSCT
jgi:hypothetical protein